MKVFLSILAGLVLIYGLIGRTPHFATKLHRVAWGAYCVLVAVSLLLRMWADLPPKWSVALLCVGHSWGIIPAAIVCVLIIAVGFFYLGCLIFCPLGDKIGERRRGR